jgi:hypothetical protein
MCKAWIVLNADCGSAPTAKTQDRPHPAAEQARTITVTNAWIKEHLMKYPILMRGVALVAALGAGSVLAQARPSATDSGLTPPVVTDVGPAPAHERESSGAIILENSMVRAQRRHAFEHAASRTGVATVGRGVLRATMQAQREADLAQAREQEAVEMYRRGASGLTEK